MKVGWAVVFQSLNQCASGVIYHPFCFRTNTLAAERVPNFLDG